MAPKLLCSASLNSVLRHCSSWDPFQQLSCQALRILQQQRVKRNDNAILHGNNCRPELHSQPWCILVCLNGAVGLHSQQKKGERTDGRRKPQAVCKHHD